MDADYRILCLKFAFESSRRNNTKDFWPRRDSEQLAATLGPIALPERLGTQSKEILQVLGWPSAEDSWFTRRVGRVHVFSDEAGDLVFKPAGNGISKYFIIGTVAMDDCSISDELIALRREFAWNGLQLDQFHATADKQRVRDRVFDIIARHELRFDATIYEKRKAYPYTYADSLYFYKLAWFNHFKHVAPEIADARDELLVVASSLQIKRKKKTTKAAVHAAIKEVVDQVSPTVICHCAFSPAQSDPCLQVADYMTWAVQRKFELGDGRSYDLIKHQVHTAYDFFKFGSKRFY